jgi:hypothetical protein
MKNIFLSDVFWWWQLVLLEHRIILLSAETLCLWLLLKLLIFLTNIYHGFDNLFGVNKLWILVIICYSNIDWFKIASYVALLSTDEYCSKSTKHYILEE